MMKLSFAAAALSLLAIGSRLSCAAECPAGYEVTAENEAGESLLTHKSDTPSVQSALEQTFPELAKMFGNRPKIASSYQDAKNPARGGATFSARWKDQAIRGIVSCTIDSSHSTVAVIFGRTDASRADWDQLINPAPAADAAIAASQPTTSVADPTAILGADSTIYSFPDGTGSITLANGWITQAASAINPVFVKGPQNQTIGIGNESIVTTPDSRLVQMQQKNEAMMRQMAARTGMRSFPPPAQAMILIAAFTDPVQAMSDLTPQFSKLSESHGGFAVKLDEIVSHQDVPAAVQGGKAAIIRNRVTRTLNGQTADYDNTIRVDMVMVGQEAWSYRTTGINAPADRFDQDKAIMFAMLNSEKLNMDVVQQRMQEQNQQNMAMIKAQSDAMNRQLTANHEQFMQQQQQRFDAGQAAHAQQMAGYAAHNEQWKQDELQKSRNNADFVETIRGTRTMYDTQTGQSSTVDLNYIGGVVDSLNQATLDPNRFVQIPLRDEMYPQTTK